MWLFKILVYFPSLLYLETTTLIALKEERSARLAGATCWNIPPKKERKINFNNRRNTTEVWKCFCYLTVFLGCLYFITVSKHTAKMLQYQAQQRLLDKHAVATPKASTQKLASPSEAGQRCPLHDIFTQILPGDLKLLKTPLCQQWIIRFFITNIDLFCLTVSGGSAVALLDSWTSLIRKARTA